MKKLRAIREALKNEIHELHMCLACDEHMGMLTKAQYNERIEALEVEVKKITKKMNEISKKGIWPS